MRLPIESSVCFDIIFFLRSNLYFEGLEGLIEFSKSAENHFNGSEQCKPCRDFPRPNLGPNVSPFQNQK